MVRELYSASGRADCWCACRKRIRDPFLVQRSKNHQKAFLADLSASKAWAYFAAQYIEFKQLNLVHRDTNEPVGFFEYHDYGARSFAWKKRDGTGGEPLGLFGYFFRALELIGFCAGGMIIPAAMAGKPYCQNCLRYMRTRELASIPASVPVKKIKKKDTAGQAAHEQEQNSAIEQGKKRLESLQAMAAAGQIDAFQTELTALKGQRKETLKLPIRMVVELIHCESCNAGKLNAAMIVGNRQQVQRSEMGQTPLTEDFVRLLRNK